MSRGVDFVRGIIQKMISQMCYGQSMKCLNVISAGNGKCKAQFTVAKQHTNPFGILHGGFTTTVADCVTSYALLTLGSDHPGVSINLHMTFLKSASVGEIITVDANTIHAGKRLAFLEAEFTKNDGNDVVALCQHTVYIRS